MVSAVAESEKEDAEVKLVKDHLLTMLKHLDADNSGNISQDEVDHVFEDDTAVEILMELDVDMKLLMDRLEMCFEHEDELAIEEIIEIILMMRGDRSPTMKDMLHTLAFSFWNEEKRIKMEALGALEGHRQHSHDKKSESQKKQV
eukprot:gnl/TRDRNA2_/TRDRNA2_217630_c0_seq1.p1 gnl/TRDRNA2_/TRDRNA2_217630_c0~~gnl/TRDRNA2_/TRDRNA2_217630_c0_seq1.p1  ORF type:complete len:152 (-),score=39.45 gnl/TRDRNA2_/TRDRNA2_217630_c0_seq1:145-579(-)